VIERNDANVSTFVDVAPTLDGRSTMRVVGERRAHPRAALEDGHAIVFVENRRVKATVLDIGTGGIALALPATVEPTMYLRINFALPAENGHEQWFDADGVVLRAAKGNDVRVLAVQFSVIEGHVASQIHGFVERARARQTQRMQAATYTARFERGGTVRELPATRDPATSATGEVPSPAAATASFPAQTPPEPSPDATARESNAISKRPRRVPSSPQAPAGAPRKLEDLYREALRQVEADAAKKGRV